MKELINAQNTIEVIKKYDFAFSKKFGQNFLVDSNVLGKMIRAAEITKEDTVLEIGPGIGTLTQALSAAAKQVVTVEIDKDLIPILKETLGECGNVTVINDDIMKVDINELAKKYSPDRNIKVVANLPYYITTPIIMELFESHAPIDSITVMVQKEVADRMKAAPSTKDYGALSLAVQFYAEPYIAAYVPQNCFIPRPNVGSAVIRLKKHLLPPVEVKDEKHMFRIIRAAFNQRRKTLQNCMSHFEELKYAKEDVAAVLRDMGISESVRGEAMSLGEFAEFSDRIQSL